MNPETITNAEVARRLDDVRSALADDIAEVRRTLEIVSGTALPRELYSARHEALVHRVNLLEANLSRVETEHRTAMDKMQIERKAEATAAAQEARANRRFLWSAIILPAVSILITIYQGLQGPA